MADFANSLARTYWCNDIRLSDRLRLWVETTQTISIRRYHGGIYHNLEKCISKTSTLDISRDYRYGYFLGSRPVWGLCRGQSLRLLVVSVCGSRVGGIALG